MIHLYWHTDPPPDVQQAAIDWRQVAGEDATIWTPDDLPDLVERARASCEDVAEIDHVRHVANIARWHLLHEHGGVWADTDVKPLRRPNGYLSRPSPWCAGLGSVPTPFICGGPARHDLWARTLAAALDHPQGSSPAASGGRLLQSMAQPSELDLVPAKLFSERDASGRLLATPPGGRYCTHEWRTSAARRREMGRP
jgi:Glycosyltransferase sugar-binding region containing DXD motif